MSLRSVFTITGGAKISRIEQKLRAIADTRLDDVLDSIGSHIVDQTVQRIVEEKRAPRGRSWPRWSKKYEKTRRSGHDLLRDEGHLLDSLTHVVSFAGGSGELQVGTNVRYAPAHQFGIGVPMRRFLGLSPANARDIEDELRDWMKKRLAR